MRTFQSGVSTAGTARVNSAPTDETLVALIAKGDQHALRTLFSRHYTRVYRFALRFVKDREAAEEVVNDAFLVVWQQAPRFEGRSLFLTWLLGIARYKALAKTKHRQVLSEALDEQLEATLIDPVERIDARMQREDSCRHLEQCVAALPPNQAKLIELHYFLGISVEEAASITGIPVNTAKTRMFLARKKLAVMLAAQDEQTPPVRLVVADRRSRARSVGPADRNRQSEGVAALS
jgi:RNA polymerase sigma-70 factor (ECF subfamily)